jgi:hypothetical protein
VEIRVQEVWLPYKKKEEKGKKEKKVKKRKYTHIYMIKKIKNIYTRKKKRISFFLL